jgi:hypothetical protein
MITDLSTSQIIISDHRLVIHDTQVRLATSPGSFGQSRRLTV